VIDTAELRSLILSLAGVYRLYPADPAWKTTVRRIRTALIPGDASEEPEYVRITTGATPATLSVRVGADGTVPAPALARSVAAALRAALGSEFPEGLKISVEVSSMLHAPAPVEPGLTP